jgi:hypothetical protein
MRWHSVSAWALGLAIFPWYVALGQLQIGLKCERGDFMLYEPIVVDILVRNNTAHQIVLSGSASNPWLSFLVTRRTDGSSLRPDRARDFPDILLQPGESRKLKINITPLVSIRASGEYLARAVVSVPGQEERITEPIYLRVSEGQALWKDVRPLDGSERMFTLLRYSPDSTSTFLYLRVEDEKENVVYNTSQLGPLTFVSKPQVYWDRDGSLHVLHTIGYGKYRYTRSDDRGKLLYRSVYDSRPTDPPQLYRDDAGIVMVVGGKAQSRIPRQKLSEATFGSDRDDEKVLPAEPIDPKLAAQKREQEMRSAQRSRAESSTDQINPRVDPDE